jgi:hypothetical protein
MEKLIPRYEKKEPQNGSHVGFRRERKTNILKGKGGLVQDSCFLRKPKRKDNAKEENPICQE